MVHGTDALVWDFTLFSTVGRQAPNEVRPVIFTFAQLLRMQTGNKTNLQKSKEFALHADADALLTLSQDRTSDKDDLIQPGIIQLVTASDDGDKAFDDSGLLCDDGSG